MPRRSSPSPIMLLRWTPKPGTQTPEPRPRLVVIVQTFPAASAATTLVVSARRSTPRRAATSSRATWASRRGSPSEKVAGPSHGVQEVIQVVTAGQHGVSPERSLARRRLDHAVDPQIVDVESRGVLDGAHQGSGEVSPVEGGRVLGQQVEGLVVIPDAPRCRRSGGEFRPVCSRPRCPLRRGRPPAPGGGARREPPRGGSRRLAFRPGGDHLGPVEAAPTTPQIVSAGRDARHRHRRRADLVRHGLADEERPRSARRGVPCRH